MNWPDHTRLHVLKPDNLNLEDETYRIPSFSDPMPLEKSIERIGIVNPPLVQERAPEKFVPVLGWRRLKAALKLGFEQVEVRTLPQNTPVSDGFRLAFWDNVAQRTLPLATTAVLVRKLLEIFPRNVVINEFLPVLGVPARGPRLERLHALGNLEYRALTWLADGRILEKTALVLTRLDRSDRTALMDVVKDLALNANKTAEVVGNLFDLSVYHGRPVSDLLLDHDAQALLGDEDLSIQERAARFRDLVRSKKFPHLADKEREFQKFCERLHLPPNVKVRPTQSFETHACSVEIRVSDRSEAQRLLEILREKIR